MSTRSGLRERSLQQLDPLGTLGALPLTHIAAIAAPVIGLLLGLARWEQTERPVFTVLAILCLIVASALLVYATSPMRAPFTGRIHWTVAGLGALAALFGSLAQTATDMTLRDQWGMITLGILLVAATPYRSARSLAMVGLAAGGFLVVLIAAESARFNLPIPLAVLIIIGILPVVALTSAGIEFANAAVTARERWQAHAASASLELASLLKPAFARSVQQDRVTVLNQEVVPFFSDLLSSEQVTDADLEHARSISEAFRAIMIADVNSGWLADAAEESAHKAGYELHAVTAVRDDARLADLLTYEQRVSVRALLVALFAESSLTPAGFSAVVTGDMKSTDMVITAQTKKPRAMHAHLRPYFAAVRVVFPHMRVATNKTHLTLRFSYEQ
ncbi:hypothetical protein [Glaciihabitans sp. dw_435]|uniref:hypothetical protein n=1 Tax=Glaciihabitans sp. dw_435 TaxID=2720081 RepID=UPI001BD279B5|nr:hypothetical protein [Glaciihabitans sp. dw_435]